MTGEKASSRSMLLLSLAVLLIVAAAAAAIYFRARGQPRVPAARAGTLVETGALPTGTAPSHGGEASPAASSSGIGSKAAAAEHPASTPVSRLPSQTGETKIAGAGEGNWAQPKPDHRPLSSKGSTGQVSDRVPAIVVAVPATSVTTPALAGTAAAAAGTSSNAAKAVVGGLLTVAVGFLITGAISISGRWFSGTPTQRQPQMTSHMAGTLSEFPVATGANPAHPTAIGSQNFSGNETPAQVRVPPKSLPPGLVPAKLPKIATSVTSAAYQARPQDPPVNVSVLNTREASQSAAEEVLKQIEVAVGPQATVTGIKVQNPSGSEYTGYRVRTQESDAYVLAKLGANILVTILSSHPSVRDVASQLAANLGNGAGLLEDPGMRGGMFSLPASPPPGFELENMAVQDTAQLDQLRASLGVSSEGQQLAEKIQRFIPQRITSSTYKGPNSEKLEVMLGEYGGTASAWTTWTMLRLALRGLSKDANVNTSVNVRGGNGVSIASQDKTALVFQRGAFLVVVHGAANAPQNHLVSLADSLQF
jgi:hypothetical protein